MSVRDFKRIKPPQGMGNVPIIGAMPPAQVRDSIGRVLQEGDFVILNVGDKKPFRITSIKAVTDPRLPPGHMQITFACTTQFYAARDQANTEFLRVMALEEVLARQAQGVDLGTGQQSQVGESAGTASEGEDRHRGAEDRKIVRPSSEVSSDEDGRHPEDHPTLKDA